MSNRQAEVAVPEEPLSEGGFRYSDRAAILCRTCLRPITWETRIEPGFLPRTGWYDDARTDPLICFRAVGYRHEPLTDREWAYYEAGQRSVTECCGHEAEAHDLAHDVDRARERLWRLAAKAGHVPHESDNDATAELVVTAALDVVLPPGVTT